jgi:hypothetical protein
MAKVVPDFVAGLGTMTGWFTKLVSLTDKLTVGNFLQNRQPNTPYDPRSGNMPDMSPAATKIIMQRQKADREAAKRQKELAALAVKQTKAIKEQTVLAKAKAVLDKASMVMNMDLIQNTAALMGKVTEDETLRLKLQQAILLGNEDAAGNLAQQLLASQIAAMKLSSTNPLGGFSDALKAALQAVKDLRDELAKLGAPKVLVPSLVSGAEQLAIDAAEAERDANNPDFAALDTARYLDDIFSRNKTTGQRINVVVSMDPMAAAAGVTTAVIDNAANGNSNNYSPIFSWAGGF